MQKPFTASEIPLCQSLQTGPSGAWVCIGIRIATIIATIHYLMPAVAGSVGGRLVEQSPSLPGQATTLLHEAYLRLVDTETAGSWNSYIFSWRRNQCV